MIGLEILMTPFATWGVIFGLIALVGCLTWIFNRGNAVAEMDDEDEEF